jgi:hypothetical protein
MAVPPDPLAVDISDVEAMLWARTFDDNGEETGVFSADTRPTDTQVNNLLAQSRRRINVILGGADPTTLDPALCDGAKNLIVLDTCCRIEKSLFPEQTSGNYNQSAYAQLRQEFQDELTEFKVALASSGEYGEGQLPDWYFGDAWWNAWWSNNGSIDWQWVANYEADVFRLKRPAAELAPPVTVPIEQSTRGIWYDPSFGETVTSNET